MLTYFDFPLEIEVSFNTGLTGAEYMDINSYCPIFISTKTILGSIEQAQVHSYWFSMHVKTNMTNYIHLAIFPSEERKEDFAAIISDVFLRDYTVVDDMCVYSLMKNLEELSSFKCDANSIDQVEQIMEAYLDPNISDTQRRDVNYWNNIGWE